jgi:hypothetical protein
MIEITLEGLKALAAELKKRLPTSEEQWRIARDGMARDVAFELEAAFSSFLECFYGYSRETAEDIAAKLDVETAERLFTRLFFEAISTTTRERTRLLCAALAGALNPDFDAEMKSRFTRAILALEPSDILLLRDRQGGETIETKGEQAVIQSQVSADALNRAGCLDYNEGGFGGGRRQTLTELGRQLLLFLKAWKPDTKGGV